MAVSGEGESIMVWLFVKLKDHFTSQESGRLWQKSQSNPYSYVELHLLSYLIHITITAATYFSAVLFLSVIRSYGIDLKGAGLCISTVKP